MKKTVWIIHQYASTDQSGMGGRHFYLGNELAKRGYTVYLIASASHHLLRKRKALVSAFEMEKIADNFNFVWVKMPHYAEAHNKKRVFNWFLFPWRIQKLTGFIQDAPDVVLSSSPSPVAFLGAQRLAKKYNARLVFEVRDIWPMTLIKIGGVSPKHPLIRFMQWLEDKAYRESDAVISNLKNAVEHMASRGMARSKFNWVPNGFSLAEVEESVPLDEPIASQLPDGKFIVGYTGTMGVANAMDSLLAAAELLREYQDIAFVMVGEGQEKARLQDVAREKQLTNVVFIQAILKVQIQAMLSRFDACYIGWLNDELYQFGIGANKIPEYLYSGRPVIHAFSGNCDPIMEANAGVRVPAEDPEQLADAVMHLYRMTPEERAVLGNNGREAALAQYEYGELSERLADVLFENTPQVDAVDVDISSV